MANDAFPCCVSISRRSLRSWHSHGRGRERQTETTQYTRRHPTCTQQEEAGQQCGGGQNLQRTKSEHQAAHRPQRSRLHFKTEREHEQDYTELGEAAQPLDVRSDPKAGGTERQTRGEQCDHRPEAEPPRERGCDHQHGKQRDDGEEERVQGYAAPFAEWPTHRQGFHLSPALEEILSVVCGGHSMQMALDHATMSLPFSSMRPFASGLKKQGVRRCVNDLRAPHETFEKRAVRTLNRSQPRLGPLQLG